MRNLLSPTRSDVDDAEIDIVVDNAKLPSNYLRHTILKPALAQDSKCSSKWNTHVSSRRHIGRYHSEPLSLSHASKQLQAPKVPRRWDCDECSASGKDEALVPPQRGCDRWGVSRINSDSALLNIMPQRSTTKCEVAQTVLSSLQRKYSASKVIANMSQSSRARLNSIDSDEDSKSIIEQLFQIPGETNRRKQEVKERFIRSILELAEETKGEKEDGVIVISARLSSCSEATLKIWGGVQAMISFFVLVLQIIAVELVGPILLNANDLVHTLVTATAPSHDLVAVHVFPKNSTLVDSSLVDDTRIQRDDLKRKQRT